MWAVALVQMVEGGRVGGEEDGEIRKDEAWFAVFDEGTGEHGEEEGGEAEVDGGREGLF